MRARGRRARHVQPGGDLRSGRAFPRQRRGPDGAAGRPRRRPGAGAMSCRRSTCTTTRERSRTCSRSRPGSSRWWSARARSSDRCATRSGRLRTRRPSGPTLNALFQHGLRVGKRAHRETRIDAAGRSLVSVALDEASQVIGDIAAGAGLHRGRRLGCRARREHGTAGRRPRHRHRVADPRERPTTRSLRRRRGGAREPRERRERWRSVLVGHRAGSRRPGDLLHGSDRRRDRGRHGCGGHDAA